MKADGRLFGASQLDNFLDLLFIEIVVENEALLRYPAKACSRM